MAHIRRAIMEEHRASMEAYKKVHEETIEEDKRREEWIQKIEEDKRRDEWIQKIEEITEKGVGKEGFGCALNKSKGSHLGLRHCAANRKRKKRKGPFVWTKSKSCVVIEVGQTKAIDGGLNRDNRLSNYKQQCQHFLMFDYDPQEGELQVKTWDPGIT
ncbi:hypothetical protein Tco_1115173 [Tanacetum coccineum]